MGKRTKEEVAEQPSDDGTAVAPGELILPEAPANPLIPAWDTPLGECPCSFDLTTPVGRVVAYNCTGAADVEIGRDGYVDFNLAGFLIYPGEWVNEETGETARCIWTCLVDVSGAVWKTTSAVIPGRLWDLLRLHGREIPSEGIPLVITERKARRSGRTYHDLKMRAPAEDS